MISYFSVRFLFLFWLTSWDLRACKGRAFAIMSSRTVETKYGQIRGTMLKFSDENLTPVESYKSLQYASTLGTQMRFMPPTSPSDRWKYIRVAFTYRSVCPQPIFKEEEVVGYLAKGEIDRRKRMVSFVMSQSEECLNLNLYVPTGKGVVLMLWPVLWYI